jgi:hypothetical protein
LHEHTKVTVLVFVTRLMAIKSKFAFSNNCYKELLNLISDVLPENHKMPKDMCCGLALKCYELRTRQHKMLNDTVLRP